MARLNKQWVMIGLLILIVFVMQEPKKEFEEYRTITHYSVNTFGIANPTIELPELTALINVRNQGNYAICADLPQGVTGTPTYIDEDGCQHWSYSTLQYAEGCYYTSSCYSNDRVNSYGNQITECDCLGSGWVSAGCYSNYDNRCSTGTQVGDYGGSYQPEPFINDCWYKVEVFDENGTSFFKTDWKRRTDGKTVLEYNGFKINFGDYMSYYIPPDSSLFECDFKTVVFHEPTNDQFNVDFIDNFIIINNNWVDVIVDIEVMEGEQIYYSEFGRLVQDNIQDIINIDTSNAQEQLIAKVRVAFPSDDFNNFQVWGQGLYEPHLETLPQVNIYEYSGQMLSPYLGFLQDKDKFLSREYSIFLFKQQADNWVVP